MNTEQLNALALISVPSLVRFDPERKTSTLMLAQATAEVLTELHLTNVDLAQKYHENPDVFAVRLGDLNEQGMSFARTGYQRWLANTDRWVGMVTLEKYKESLRKQWIKSRGKAL